MKMGSVGPEHGWRVKVYRLSTTGEWDLKGTGRVKCKFNASLNSEAVVVVSEAAEDNGKLLLENKVVLNKDAYSRHSESIIIWKEPSTDVDIALSFADSRGCEEIWSKICAVQGRRIYMSPARGEDAEDGKDGDDEMTLSETSEAKEDHDDLDEIQVNVLAVTQENLPEIHNLFEQIVNTGPVLKGYYAKALSSKDENGRTYLEQLLALFRELERKEKNSALAAEELEKTRASLAHLFEAVKCMALLNDADLFESMLNSANFMDVVGVVEHDPTLYRTPNYREFLRTQVKHKEIIPVKNKLILELVHQNFRISYLRDVLLPRALDEVSLAVLGDMEKRNGVLIAIALHNDAEFISQLFRLLKQEKNDEPGNYSRPEVVAFLHELCSLAKRMQVTERHAFYRSLTENAKEGSFLPIIEHLLADENSTSGERLHAADILKVMLEHESELVRAYILKNNNHPRPPPAITDANVESAMEDPSQFAVADTKKLSLLAQLIKRLVHDPEPGMQALACDVLRAMLDPESMEVSEKERFLQVFYESYVQWLVYPLQFAGKQRKKPEKSTAEDRSAQAHWRKLNETARVAEHHITELLSVCVQTHGYRIKYYILRNSIVSKVLLLLDSREKHLVLDAIRFVRTCVGLKDDFYNRHLVRDDLFKGLFMIFSRNGKRNNLINSAIIELIEFIWMENIITLIVYIIEKYGDILKKIDYVDTYNSLKRMVRCKRINPSLLIHSTLLYLTVRSAPRQNRNGSATPRQENCSCQNRP